MKLPGKRTKAAIIMAALAASAVHAEGTDEDELALVYGDRSTLRIATGNALSLRRAPAVATVITAQDIAALGATDLDQVLESVAGVHVNRSANNYSPLYVVRGIVSQFTPQLLVLQNGVPITTLYHGNKGNLWGGYPVEHIARIEIIRGPGSALYGSDAFSGVINIITKNAADTPGTEVGLRSGSFRSGDAWVQHGGQIGAASVAAYVRVGATDGFRSLLEADAQSRNDGLFGTHASLAPGPVNVGVHSLDMNLDLQWQQWRLIMGYKLRDHLGTGAGIASALDPVGYSKSQRISTDLAWTDEQFAPDWNVGVRLSGQHYIQLTPEDYQLLPPGTRLPTGSFANGMRGGPDTWEHILRLSAYANYSAWSGHHVRLGAGHEDLNLYRTFETRNFNYTAGGTPIPLPSVIDTTPTNPFLRPQLRKVDYLFVQDEWQLGPDWAMTAGLRHDHYSDFGGTTNPRLALVFDASQSTTLKLLYGRAFRAPAFVESYGITNPVVQGNPLLKPETNRTFEGVVNWQPAASLQLNATLYRYAMANIIRTLPNAVAGTGATYGNAGSQSGHGVELESSWTPARALRVAASLALQSSTDENTGVDAGYAPHRHLFVRADWQFAEHYLFNAALNHVADRRRSFGDARAPIPDYTSVDLSLHQRPGQGHWNFSVALRNAFNADMREPSLAPGLALPRDLPMAPRALYVQAVYRL